MESPNVETLDVTHLPIEAMISEGSPVSSAVPILPPFEAFPKIPRLSREMIITEKLDGTNAQVYIGSDGTFAVGSRNRWITPEKDNYGFAAWAYAHKEELMALGHGRHFGEWWGQGVQRGYGLTEKRFSLFNVDRYSKNPNFPACCLVVPVLFRGDFNTTTINDIMAGLKINGSVAAPGFMNPEGIVVFHKQSGGLFKKTFEYDATGKEQAVAA